MCLRASCLATGGFKFVISKFMRGLQACLFKYITVAAFHIYVQCVEDAAKGEVGGHAYNSHGNYIVDHGKSWKNHGIVFLNFCGNPFINR